MLNKNISFEEKLYNKILSLADKYLTHEILENLGLTIWAKMVDDNVVIYRDKDLRYYLFEVTGKGLKYKS